MIGPIMSFCLVFVFVFFLENYHFVLLYHRELYICTQDLLSCSLHFSVSHSFQLPLNNPTQKKGKKKTFKKLQMAAPPWVPFPHRQAWRSNQVPSFPSNSIQLNLVTSDYIVSLLSLSLHCSSILSLPTPLYQVSNTKFGCRQLSQFIATAYRTFYFYFSMFSFRLLSTQIFFFFLYISFLFMNS